MKDAEQVIVPVGELPAYMRQRLSLGVTALAVSSEWDRWIDEKNYPADGSVQPIFEIERRMGLHRPQLVRHGSRVQPIPLERLPGRKPKAMKVKRGTARAKRRAHLQKAAA